jgi:predicted ATPase
MLHGFGRDVAALTPLVDELLRLSQERGIGFWLGVGLMMRGWLDARRGHPPEGSEVMREGLALWRAAGWTAFCPKYLAYIAETAMSCGRLAEAEEALEQASGLLERTGEKFAQADIMRLRSELLLQQDPSSSSKVELLLREAVACARHQGARMYELRTTTRLAELLRRQNRSRDARDVLAPVYACFTEGFETPDLQRACSEMASLLA